MKAAPAIQRRRRCRLPHPGQCAGPDRGPRRRKIARAEAEIRHSRRRADLAHGAIGPAPAGRSPSLADLSDLGEDSESIVAVLRAAVETKSGASHAAEGADHLCQITGSRAGRGAKT